MDSENGFASLHIGTIQSHAAVEAAGAQQRRVEDVGAVGGGDDDDVGIGVEAVHLDQHLVQGLLTLIVRTAQPCATLASYGIDFIHKDDTGGMSLGLIEQVAHTACAHAHEHLDEFRTRDGEERHARFTGDSFRQQGLARSGRSNQ